MMTEEEEAEFIEVGHSEADMCDSDDCEGDPSFNILEETQSRFSNLSVKKKISKSRIHKEMVTDVVGDDPDAIEMTVSELCEKDQQSFEIVQKIIEVGQVEKLKVEQCKLYLRKHGLRLTGKKDVLIDRIKEHLSIMNGGGENKYPASSFVMNCKGDACTGDIVMFEQNVYEMYSIASRSASGPPCGTRIVAGRIVKESYGAAKQQHTFTIEVLWSKGVKPLPPLHPLLIKGRNLYRLNTMRQKRWEDEGQRQRILSEKHARGTAARSNRETRVQEKEMKKTLRESRISKKNIHDKKQEEKNRKTSPAVPVTNARTTSLSAELDRQKSSIQVQALNQQVLSHASVPFEGVDRRMPTSMIHNYRDKENINSNVLGGPVRGEQMDIQKVYFSPPNGNLRRGTFQVQQGFNHPLTQFQRHSYEVRKNFYSFPSVSRSHNFQGGNNNGHSSRSHSRGHDHGQKQQLCRYYAQGRCHYGTNCKYLH